MSNRFTNIVPSRFDERSLNEIMTIPLAKQAQHDATLAGYDALSAKQSQYHSSDREAVQAATGEIKDRVSGLSDDIIGRGITRDSKNEFRRIKQESDHLYGSEGLAGRAEANAKSINDYVKRMSTNKDAQAGWSPQEARAFALSEAGKFSGTDAGDGTFNSFSGRELTAKMNEEEFIDSAIESVAEKVSTDAMRMIRIGGLPDFHRAFSENKVSRKDYVNIMDAITTRAKTSPDFMAHLRQQAEFTGRDDYMDIGSVGIETTIDPNTGKKINRKTFTEGKGRFGQKAAGRGRVGQYYNYDVSTKIIKDEAGYALWSSGMEEEAAIRTINFNNGELNNIPVDDLDSLETDLELYGDQSKQFGRERDARKAVLIAENPGMEEEDLNNLINQDREVKRLSVAYNEAKVTYDNSKVRFDDLMKYSLGTLSGEDKAMLNVKQAISESGGNIYDAIADFNSSSNGKSIDISLEGVPQSVLNLRGNKEENIRRYHQKEYAKAMGVDISDVKGNHLVFDRAMEDVIDRRNDASQNYVDANPRSGYFTRVNAQSAGKYSTVIGNSDKMRSQNFIPSAHQLSHGKGRIEDSPEVKELGDSTEGFSYIYETTTDGYDNYGNHFNNVIIVNNESGDRASVQVIAPDRDGSLRDLGKNLLGGNYKQAEMGRQTLANIDYMPAIKRSKLWDNSSGQIALNLGLFDNSGDPVNASYNKVEPSKGDAYWLVTLGDEVINDGKPLYGEEEIAQALYNDIERMKIENNINNK